MPSPRTLGFDVDQPLSAASLRSGDAHSHGAPLPVEVSIANFLWHKLYKLLLVITVHFIGSVVSSLPWPAMWTVHVS